MMADYRFDSNDGVKNLHDGLMRLVGCPFFCLVLSASRFPAMWNGKKCREQADVERVEEVERDLKKTV